ncbi:MAG: hypothetical protein HKN91_16495 [Acidimicrobiia bacterium]|nr:hypothetical protein [Acidimicrobiia bacterium]
MNTSQTETPEANGAPTPFFERVRSALAWVGRTRAVRFPLLVALGAVVTVLASSYVQHDYVSFCRQYWVFDGRCQPVTPATAQSVGFTIAGLFMIIIAPVINSLYHLFRYGAQWEFTRVETAISNYPMLAGVIYLAVAGVFAFS